ncbi:hypothetical protein Trydic_g215 [Trypoxylus dichotomus]
MPKRRELTVAERNQIVLLHSQDMSQKNCFNNEEFATCDTINHCFQTPKQLIADVSVEQDVSVCNRTVRRRLAEVNLKGRKARRKPYLSQQQINNRLLWARRTVEDWSKVIWSDESNIQIP